MKRKNIILCGIIMAMGMCVHFLFTKPLIAAESKEISIPVQGYVGSTSPEESSESGEINPIYVQTSDSNSGWIPMIAILMSSILFVYIVVNKGTNSNIR